MDSREEIIAFFLSKLRLIQLEPGNRTYKSYLFLICIIGANFTGTYYGGMYVAKSKHFLEMANGVKTLLAHFHLLKLIAVLHEKDILYLFENTRRFWDDESTEKMNKLALRGAKTFQNFLYLTYALVVVLPILFGYIPFDVYISDFTGAFWMHAILQCIHFYFLMEILILSDCFFMCLSVLVKEQFRVLNERLENLGTTQIITIDEGRICVQHHDFLLQYTKIFAFMFRYPLLAQYCITTLSICVELFVLPEQDMQGILMSVIYLLALLFQLSMFCFPADLVIQEALHTRQAIFNSNWYNHPRFAKVFVQQIIRRSQKEIVFNAAGLVNINKIALTMVFKWTASFYMLMRDMADLID